MMDWTRVLYIDLVIKIYYHLPMYGTLSLLLRLPVRAAALLHGLLLLSPKPPPQSHVIALYLV